MRISCWFYTSFVIIELCHGISSPIRPLSAHDHSIELQANVADLWWTVNEIEQDIIFELHMKTTGWIALGISPAGGMKGADIVIGWIQSSGNVYIQDRFAIDKTTPIIDNTTQNWFIIQGREQNGWTAIQFKRFFDTCDTMDVPIKSGTNILIFAYGLVDLDFYQPNIDITYHNDRKGTRILPLRSYIDQPKEETYQALDFFDFLFNDYLVPSTDTTYYCKVFKSPSRFLVKKHAIAHKILIDSRNIQLVHHLDLFECTSRDVINDTELPDGVCDDVLSGTRMCSSKLATSWSIGGDPITVYPEEAGYPVTNDIGSKYFMIKIHYDNPRLISDLRDSSGIRFYLADQLREHDLGYVLFGVSSTAASLAIPPKTQRFIVDSYCPPEATKDFPRSGVNVVSALPHTHLQGFSVSTMLIRNSTAVQYLFNAESFNFNYQFTNRLSKPIKLYPGDAFITRCVYSTQDKDRITLGGQRTADEMCSHTFAYYPFMNSLSACISSIHGTAWQMIMNTSSSINNTQLEQWLLSRTWTPNSVSEWQNFYKQATRFILYDLGSHVESKVVSIIPTYEQVKSDKCNNTENVDSGRQPSNHAKNMVNTKEKPLISILLLGFLRFTFQ